MSQTAIPVARYRVNNTTNGGTTIQNISSNRIENRQVLDTKALQNITSRALTEVIQADIGGNVSFKIPTFGILPVPIPVKLPNNPHTT